MATVKTTGYLYLYITSPSDAPTLKVFGYQLSDTSGGWVYLQPIELAAEIHDDLKVYFPEIVAGLRKKQAEIYTEAEIEAKALGDKIQKFLAIGNTTHSVTVVASEDDLDF